MNCNLLLKSEKMKKLTIPVILGSQDWEVWLSAANDDFQSIGVKPGWHNLAGRSPALEPQKGPLGPKRAVLGAQGVSKRPP